MISLLRYQSLKMPKLIEESKQGIKSSFVPYLGLLSNNHSYFQKKKNGKNFG